MQTSRHPACCENPALQNRHSQNEAAHMVQPESLQADATGQAALDPGARVGARVHQLRLRAPRLDVWAVLPPATQPLPELLLPSRCDACRTHWQVLAQHAKLKVRISRHAQSLQHISAVPDWLGYRPPTSSNARLQT